MPNLGPLKNNLYCYLLMKRLYLKKEYLKGTDLSDPNAINTTQATANTNESINTPVNEDLKEIKELKKQLYLKNKFLLGNGNILSKNDWNDIFASKDLHLYLRI